VHSVRRRAMECEKIIEGGVVDMLKMSIIGHLECAGSEPSLFRRCGDDAKRPMDKNDKSDDFSHFFRRKWGFRLRNAAYFGINRNFIIF
jgi:hypothetical protein